MLRVAGQRAFICQTLQAINLFLGFSTAYTVLAVIIFRFRVCTLCLFLENIFSFCFVPSLVGVG